MTCPLIADPENYCETCAMSYAKAFEIVDVAVKSLEQRGWNFREGVKRAAALAAMEQRSNSAIVEAIEDVLEQHRTAIDATGWAEAAFDAPVTVFVGGESFSG